VPRVADRFAGDCHARRFERREADTRRGVLQTVAWDADDRHFPMTRGRLLLTWDALRTSLWFVPALVVVALVVLAIALVEIDVVVDARTLARFPRLFGAGAEGSRGMLEAIAGAMITVAGVTFSITIVALSLTASQYSSRVLRNFMRDRTNQVVLGVFVGVYAYCLIVLRTIRGGDSEPFVPSIATLGAVILAFVGIGLLIHFIHHISTSIQASHILASIYEETSNAVCRLYPEQVGDELEEPEEAARAELDGLAWTAVESEATGYLQSVDIDSLVVAACNCASVVVLEHRIGDFVIAGHAVARISGSSHTKDAAAGVRSALVLGDQRTVEQDAAFGIRQIVDIALKAISPAINDPTTGAMCVDRLSGLMLMLANRRIPSPYRRVDGQLRVFAPAHDFASFLDLAITEIRSYAKDQPHMLVRLLALLEKVGRTCASASKRQAIDAQLVAFRSIVQVLPLPGPRAEVARAIDRAAHPLT
jgi:uncharacterized membrane protein